MARDPNELKYPESWKNDPEDLKKLPKPAGIPDAELYGGNYYANVKIYQDGRQVVQWYKRGTGTPGASSPDDPVQATSQGVIPSVKEEWDKDEAKPPATRPINGVPHQVVGKDAAGNDIWAPVQTTTGPASAAASTITSTTAPRVPAGSVPRIEGTPIPGSNPVQYDNSRPIKAWHTPPTAANPNGTIIYEDLDENERKRWERDKNGGLTDDEVRQQGQTASDSKPLEGYPGWTVRTTKQGANTQTVFVNPQGQVAPDPRPPANAPQPVAANTAAPYLVERGPNGEIKTTPNPNYQGEKPERSVTKGADGRTYVVTVGKDGKATASPVEGLPAEPTKAPERIQYPESGQTLERGTDGIWRPIKTEGVDRPPPSDNGPQMTPGMTPSAYLLARRQYYIDQRRAGTMTQAQVNEAWDRDKDVAVQSHNEASLSATQQNQRLATSMSGFNSAMSEIGTLNRYLPVGSDLGGKALEATLGLQYAQAQRMGGYGTQPAPLAVPPAPNEPDPSAQVAAIPPAPSPAAASARGQPGDPSLADMGARQAASRANPVFRPQPPAMSAPPAVQGTPSPLGDTGAAPVSFMPAAIPESPYDFQARVANTPPWMMDEATWQRARDMGLEDQFWSVPGAAA